MLVHEKIDLPGSYGALFLRIVASLRKFFAVPPEVQHRIEIVASFAAMCPLSRSVSSEEHGHRWVFALARELDAEVDEEFIFQCNSFAWVVARLSEFSPMQRRWLEDVVSRLDPIDLIGALPESWSDHSLEALTTAFRAIEPESFEFASELRGQRKAPEEFAPIDEALRALREFGYVGHGLKPIPLDEDVDLWRVVNEACFELFMRLPHNQALILEALASESNERYYDAVHARVRELMRKQGLGFWSLARRIRKLRGGRRVGRREVKKWLSPGFISTDKSRRLLAQGLGVTQEAIDGSYDNFFDREYEPRLRASIDWSFNTASYRSEVEFGGKRADYFRNAVSALAKAQGVPLSEFVSKHLQKFAALATIVVSDVCAPPRLLDVYLFSREIEVPVDTLWVFD